MRLVQVVPRARPGDGVADYAAQLGRALGERHGVSTLFVEAGPVAGPAGLLDALHATATGIGLLLHYVGYGYARRGAPLWLARALDRRARPGPRLGVVFHELYATGRPWQSAFWLSPLQRHIVSRVARRSEFALITREASRQWLERAGALAGKPVSVLAVPSNVGEPRDPGPVRDRPPVMIVWGSCAARSGLYADHAARLGAACRAFGITRIVDIGPHVAPASVAGLPVEMQGALPADQLSHALLSARCGVVAYPASFLAKSGIFAAYAAHGVAPLVLDEPRTAPLDGLAAGRQFLRLVADGVDDAGTPLDAIAQHARAWYAQHTTAAHADAVWRMLREHA